MPPISISIFELLGIGVLAFGVCWGIFALHLLFRTRHKLAGILIGVASLIGVGVFAYLTRSTTARRAFINLDMGPLLSTVLRDLVAVLLAIGVFWLITRLTRRLQNGSTLIYGLANVVGVAIIIAPILLYLYSNTFIADLDEVFRDVETVEGVSIEKDIPIRIYEDQVVRAPAAMTIGPDGALWVTGGGQPDGAVWRLVDEDNDGKAEVTVFAEKLREPEGLVWGEDGLFVNEEGRLIRLNDTDGDGKADETTVILDGFPGEVYAFHQNHGLLWGPDGRLYIGSGSTTDHDPEPHPMAAVILSINPDGSDMKVFATGLRNPFGIVLAPDGKGFFAIENSASGCTDDACTEIYDVPEEVNYIVEGGDYGFPRYFGLPPEDSGTLPPVITFPEHSAPTGIVFYEGDKFPALMKGQLFVSLWTRGEIYRIRLYKIDEQRYMGSPLLFAKGLSGPSAMINAPDGGLFVSSYNGSAIYYIG